MHAIEILKAELEEKNNLLKNRKVRRQNAQGKKTPKTISAINLIFRSIIPLWALIIRVESKETFQINVVLKIFV